MTRTLRPKRAWRAALSEVITPDDAMRWVNLMLAKGALTLQDPSEQDYPCIIELQKDTCSL